MNIDYVVMKAAWGAVTVFGLLPLSINNRGPLEGNLAATVADAGISSESALSLSLLWLFIQLIICLFAGVALFPVLRKTTEQTEITGNRGEGP